MSNVRFTEWNPMAVVAMAKRVSRRNLEEASQMLIDKIKEDMRSSKTGRIYNIGGTRHTASAGGEFPSGESPAVLTAELINSLEYKIVEEGNEIISKIGVNVDGNEKGYAISLELGWTDKSDKYHPPHAYLRRAVFFNGDEIRRILNG